MKRPLMFVNCLKAILICYVDDFLLLLQHTGTTVSVGTMVGKESLVLTRRFWALPTLVKNHSKYKEIITQDFSLLCYDHAFHASVVPNCNGKPPKPSRLELSRVPVEKCLLVAMVLRCRMTTSRCNVTYLQMFETMWSILCQTMKTTTNWAGSSKTRGSALRKAALVPASSLVPHWFVR